MSEAVELAQVWLGMEPYVLVRFKLDDDGELAADISAGGGPESQEDVGAALAMALSGLPLSANPYAEVLDQIEAENQIDYDGDLALGEINRREGVLHAITQVRQEMGLIES
jgi:hypothetical protein